MQNNISRLTSNVSRFTFHLSRLTSHPGFRKYFANTSWLFAEKVLRMAVGLFVGVWVARYLGPEQFGLLSYAQSFVGLFTVVATLGLDGIVVRELVKDETKRDELMGTSFWLKLMGALGVLVILAIAVNFTSNDAYTNTLVFIIASATVFQSFNVIDMYFQSKVMGKYITLANTISLFAGSIVKIVLILSKAPLIAFAGVIVFESFFLALGFVYFYVKNTTTLRMKNFVFKKETAMSLLKDSWPLVLSGIVVSIYMKIDQVMIKEMLGSEAVGQYAAAVRISEAWFSVGVILCNSLFPAIVNAKKVSKNLYYFRLQNLFLLLVSLAYSLSVIVYVFRSSIIDILYGSKYNQSASVLVIHIFSAIFVYLGVASGRWLIVEEKTMYNLYRTFSGMLVNVVLNLLFIKTHGIIGAAYASLLSYVFSYYIFDIFFKSSRKLFVLKTQALFLQRGKQ